MHEQRKNYGMRRESMMRMVGVGLVGAMALAACSSEAGPSQTVAASSTSVEKKGEAQKSHTVTATIYWIGETESADNGNISNVASAWDENAVKTFGGVDGFNRKFKPKHNTYYFALPAAEYDESGLIKGAREASPWSDKIGSLAEGASLFKGNWIKVSKTGMNIYAQWQDVGPNEERDYAYVFGKEKPENTFGLHAGIDLSPDAAQALGLTDGGTEVTWQFVDSQDVPDGPWNKYPHIDNVTRWN